MVRKDMTDEELAALIDNIEENGSNSKSDTAFSIDDIEVMSVTRKAIKLEKKPLISFFSKFKTVKDSRIRINYGRQQKSPRIARDIWRIALVPSFSVAALLCIMFFSPLSQQYIDSGLGRGGIDNLAVDSLILSNDYRSALEIVDVEIEETSDGLPRIAFFDRFLPEEDGTRYEASLARAEIYELKWKRINILYAQRNEAALLQALKEYTAILGYHQHEAQEMMKQIEQ